MHKFSVHDEMNYYPVVIEAGSKAEAVEIYRRKYAGPSARLFYVSEIA